MSENDLLDELDSRSITGMTLYERAKWLAKLAAHQRRKAEISDRAADEHLAARSATPTTPQTSDAVSHPNESQLIEITREEAKSLPFPISEWTRENGLKYYKSR